MSACSSGERSTKGIWFQKGAFGAAGAARHVPRLHRFQSTSFAISLKMVQAKSERTFITGQGKGWGTTLLYIAIRDQISTLSLGSE